MHKYLVLLVVGWAWLGSEPQEAPPPGCRPLTYFGVQGCEPSREGRCPKGYHKQMACPTNPMMKAPCRQVCVADAKKDDAPKVPDTRSQAVGPQGLRLKSVNALGTRTSGAGKGDAIIARTEIFPRVDEIFWYREGRSGRGPTRRGLLSGEDYSMRFISMRITE